jgi:hypothetical protein
LSEELVSRDEPDPGPRRFGLHLELGDDGRPVCVAGPNAARTERGALIVPMVAIEVLNFNEPAVIRMLQAEQALDGGYLTKGDA